MRDQDWKIIWRRILNSWLYQCRSDCDLFFAEPIHACSHYSFPSGANTAGNEWDRLPVFSAYQVVCISITRVRMWRMLIRHRRTRVVRASKQRYVKIKEVGLFHFRTLFSFVPIFLDCNLPVTPPEVHHFCHPCNGPGEEVEQVQRGKCVKMGEDCEYPDHAEHAGS